MYLVVWEYTDGRNPPGRTIEGDAAHMHAFLQRGYPIKVHTPDVYAAFCEANGLEPVGSARAEPVKTDRPDSRGDVMLDPDRVRLERSGPYYSIFIEARALEILAAED